MKHLADGAMTLAVGSGASSYYGWFLFVNANAPGIGVILSFIFGAIGLVFYFLTWKKSTLADENKIGLDSLSKSFIDHKEETSLQFSQVNSGIQSTNNKLDAIIDKLS